MGERREMVTIERLVDAWGPGHVVEIIVDSDSGDRWVTVNVWADGQTRLVSTEGAGGIEGALSASLAAAKSGEAVPHG